MGSTSRAKSTRSAAHRGAAALARTARQKAIRRPKGDNEQGVMTAAREEGESVSGGFATSSSYRRGPGGSNRPPEPLERRCPKIVLPRRPEGLYLVQQPSADGDGTFVRGVDNPV